MSPLFRRKIAATLLIFILALFCGSIFFTTMWKDYVYYVLFSLLRPLGIEKLPISLAVSIGFVVVYGPIIALGGLVGVALRPYIRTPANEIYENQSRRITDAQKAFRESLSYLEGLSQEIHQKFAELEVLSQNLATMEALHHDNEISLRHKIAFINRKPIWLTAMTHTAALIAGVFGSIIANYIYDYLK